MDFIPDLQPSKQVVPAVAALHNPAPCLVPRVFLSFFLLLATRLDVGNVPAPRRRTAKLRIVVALVVAQMLPRLFLGRRARNHDGVQRGAEHLHVVAVSAGERDRQRNAVGVREHVPLGAQFASIRGVFSGLIPPLTGADTVALSIDWKRQSIPWRSS